MQSEISAVTIRSAVEGDVLALTHLCEQLGYPISSERLAERLFDLFGHPSHAILVAVNADDKVIGWIHGHVRQLLIADAHIEIGGLIIDDAYRGNRIGEELLKTIEKWTQGLGIKTVFVRSNIIREDAHRFYERLGYSQIKTSLTFLKALSKH